MPQTGCAAGEPDLSLRHGTQIMLAAQAVNRVPILGVRRGRAKCSSKRIAAFSQRDNLCRVASPLAGALRGTHFDAHEPAPFGTSTAKSDAF